MKKIKHILESELVISDMIKEDSGQFLSFSISEKPEEENGIFINISSWDVNLKHEDFEKIINRKVRVTIETID